MKSKKTVVALLSVLMAATVAHNQVWASDEIKDTVAKTSTTRLLTRANGAEFARFVEKKVGKSSMGNFLTVVNLYDAAPAQLLNADANTRHEFRASVQKLNEGLAKVNGPEAAAWLERVNRTANTIVFLWNYQPSQFVPVFVENEVVTEGILL